MPTEDIGHDRELEPETVPAAALEQKATFVGALTVILGSVLPWGQIFGQIYYVSKGTAFSH